MKNPAHFEIISSGRHFDHDAAAALSRDNAELVALSEEMLAEAFEKGQLKPADLNQVQIAGRALVYGFARMNVDGHFPRWGVARGGDRANGGGGHRSLHQGDRETLILMVRRRDCAVSGRCFPSPGEP
jgi:hypothetical protein